MMSMVATDNETKRPRDEIGGQAVNCGMCGDFLSRYEFRWSAVKVSGWLCGRHKIRGILAICQWTQTTCFSSTAFRDCFRCFFHHDILCKF